MIRKMIVFFSSLMALLSGSHSVASKVPDQASLETRVQNVQQALKRSDAEKRGKSYQSDAGTQIAQGWNDWNNYWNDWNNYWNDWNDWGNWLNY